MAPCAERSKSELGKPPMVNRILIIDGHPDKDAARLCHALVAAYVEGVRERGRETRVIRLAEITFPWLRSRTEFEAPPDAPDILNAQADIAWADELVFVFPLWIGSAPGLVRAFLEQVLRGGFFAETNTKGYKPKLKGKSARLIVTMGMPAWFYRLFFGARGVRSIADNLRLCGVAPVRTTLFGAVESPRAPQGALARTKALGAAR